MKEITNDARNDSGAGAVGQSLFDCAYGLTSEDINKDKQSKQTKKTDSGQGDSSPIAYPADSPPGTIAGDGRPNGHNGAASGPFPVSGPGSDGGMGAAFDGGAMPQKIPAEFQFSREKTAAAALNMFAKDELDLNGDGFVNKIELSRKHDELAEAAKKNPKSKEILEKQQAVNYMIMDYSKLSSAHDDEFFSETSGITIHDLASTVSSVNKAKHSGN